MSSNFTRILTRFILPAGVVLAVAAALVMLARPSTEPDSERGSPTDHAFLQQNEEWSWFLVPDRAGRTPGPILGSDEEEGGRSSVQGSFLQSELGYETFVLDYEVDDYVYVAFRKENRVRQVLTYPLGSHAYFSFFVKGEPGTYLEVSLRDDAGRQSLWALTLPPEVNPVEWTNVQLAVEDLVPARNREPVEMVEAAAFAIVRRPEEGNRPIAGRLELALLSFTDAQGQRTGLPYISPADVPRTRTYFRADGPATPTPPPTTTVPPTSTERFRVGGATGVALYVLDDASDWLGLAHGLKSMGIPMRIVHSFEEARRNPLILITPAISAIPEEETGAVVEYVRDGGTLIGVADREMAAHPLRSLFGVDSLELVVEPRHLQLERSAGIHLPFLVQEQEVAVPLYDHLAKRALVPAWGLDLAPGATAIGRYDAAGPAAISRYQYQAGGVAYAVGVDLSQLILRAHNDQSVGAADHYINRYYPANDLFLRLILDAYRGAAPSSAVRLRTAPDGFDVPVLLTHDVGESIAFRHAQDFAASERARGVDATYFIFTKYNVPEFSDDDYLFHSVDGRPTSDWIRAIAEEHGHELANHSVTHAPDFDESSHWPIGTGEETFESYYTWIECEGPRPESDCDAVPRIRRCRTADDQCGLKRTVGGSLLGELRVAKHLVEVVSPRPVVSFRPGFLFWPHDLAQTLVATGHRYSSIGTCNAHLTHLPYQLNHAKGRTEVDVYEFCIGSDDQAAPLTDVYEPGTRLYEALDLIDRLSEYGGIFVQLIHPADTWSSWRQNLQFQEALIDRLKPQPNLAHFTTVAAFGEFWAARDHVQVEVSSSGDRHRLTITAPKPVKGLSLDIPDSWRAVGENDRALTEVVLDADRHVLTIGDRISGTVSIDINP